MSQQELGGGRIGVLSNGSRGREVVEPDGSVERASELASEPLMGAVPVPERLGGGSLFWTGRVLYRARSFLGPLEVVAPIPTNVVGVEFGADFVLVFSPDAPPKAYGLAPPRRLPLSPHGVIDVASTEDGRSLALDATGRALASTDGGKSWKDVTTAIGAPVRGLHDDGQEIAFAVGKNAGAWLQRDGQLVERAYAAKPSAPPETQAKDLLRRAVVAGEPLSDTRALVGDGRGTREVDLASGSVSAVKPAGPEGSSCVPLSIDEEGLVVCFSFGASPKTLIVSHALGAAPQIEKTFPGTPEFISGHPQLSVSTSCAGAPTEGVACVRRGPGAWVEVSVPGALLATWRPLFWIPRDDGSVAVIARERKGPGPAPTVALIDPATGALTPWDAPLERVFPSRRGGSLGASLTLRADGTLRGFTATGAITVDANGHVSKPARNFASLSCAGAHALARDDAERLWQTSDFGEHWVEVAPPPFESAPAGVAPHLLRAGGLEEVLGKHSGGHAARIDCSLVGCALEHPSGAGSWLRLGWPKDPPHVSGRVASASDQNAKAATLAAPPPLPTPTLPTLRCVARAGSPSLDTPQPQRAPDPKVRGVEWADVFAGRRMLVRRGEHAYANIGYRDAFSISETYVGYGLRAAVHLEAPEGSALEPLIERNAPFDALFVDPFDPAGRTRQFTGSLRSFAVKAAAAPTGAPAPRRADGAPPLEFDHHEGAARPVLSADPGHADGVLLLDGGLSFWASSSGRVRALLPWCAPESGYSDAHGKLFVACADWSGATQIVDSMDARTLLRLPAAAHFRDERRPGMAAFPPGSPVFVNPDSIAVGLDGKLRVLRLAPGDEPPTVDNPAWLLSVDAAPVELAPWSSLEVATSAACRSGDGYRAIVQTSRSWIDVAGSSAVRLAPGMTALVRWSSERVCLEAVEVPLRQLQQNADPSHTLQVMAVARFVGAGAGSAFVGTESSAVAREPATCELELAPRQ